MCGLLLEVMLLSDCLASKELLSSAYIYLQALGELGVWWLGLYWNVTMLSLLVSPSTPCGTVIWTRPFGA